MVAHWAAEFRRDRRSLQVEPQDAHAIENAVMQNRRVSVLRISDDVAISTGCQLVELRFCVNIKMLIVKICTMGPPLPNS